MSIVMVTERHTTKVMTLDGKFHLFFYNQAQNLTIFRPWQCPKKRYHNENTRLTNCRYDGASNRQYGATQVYRSLGDQEDNHFPLDRRQASCYPEHPDPPPPKDEIDDWPPEQPPQPQPMASHPPTEPTSEPQKPKTETTTRQVPHPSSSISPPQPTMASPILPPQNPAPDIAPSPPLQPGSKLRILGVGDSITVGFPSDGDGNGYRLQLRNGLSRKDF
jgi:hypothetical protein